MTRPGFALLFAMLMTLLLSMAALGMIALSTREAIVAGAAARRVQARAGAESVARTVFHTWSTRDFATMDPGETSPLTADAGTGIVIERIDSTLFLIRAEARVPPGAAAGAVSRAGLLARVFDPTRTTRSFPAAATVTGAATLLDGIIDGQDGCGSGRHGPGIMTPSLGQSSGAIVEGSPPVLLEDPPDPATADPLAPPLTAAIADLRPQPMTVSPRPLADGTECVRDSRNWGAVDPTHLCHTLRPLVFVDHDLTVSGGEAHGVLVVDGDLQVIGSARLAGLIVVHGTLTAGEGSSIRGAVRAGALILNGGAVMSDPCLRDGAVSAPALDAAYRPSTRWWIPVF